jgi:hypothetical protein
LHFYSYDASNWNADDKKINILRTIRPDGDLFLVTLNVTLPLGARGSFVIYDRVPSNMRYMPLRRRDSNAPFFSVHNTQRQLVELNFFVGENSPLSRTLTYHTTELFEADMSPGVTHIVSRRTDNPVWGSTQ